MNKTLAAFLALGALSLSGCVSFGGDAPDSLLTLTPASTTSAGTASTGALSSAIIVDYLEVDRKLDVNRVAVQVDDSSIAYLKDAVWVDKPDRLFRGLLSETISADTGRLVLDTVNAAGQTGNRLSGRLVEFGYDARSKEAIVVFDAVRRVGDGNVEKHRFEARRDVTKAEAGPVGASLNAAANDVAKQVSTWIK